MKARVLKQISDLRENREPLAGMDWPDPVPAEGELLIKVSACGVCHTELDEIEGRTPPPRLPVILGHQVVGPGGGVRAAGAAVSKPGDRVGVAWIYSACGVCTFCRSGRENLCADFRATGRDADGGYAEYMIVPEDFAYPIPEVFTDAEAAPLLCAGAIGYRSLRLTGLQDGQTLGLTGFGASAHLVLKMVRHRYPNTRVFVFARDAQRSGSSPGSWARPGPGTSTTTPPEKLRRIIDTTPAWKPIVEALKNLEPGGRLVINAIRKEDARQGRPACGWTTPTHLWMEKEIKSVANVTRPTWGSFWSWRPRSPSGPRSRSTAWRRRTGRSSSSRSGRSGARRCL